MNKQTMFQYLYVGLIVAVILFMVGMVFWLKSESYQCIKEPLEYYSQKLGTECYCMGDFGG